MSDFLMKVVKCLDQIKAQGLSNLEYDGKKLKWRNDFAELKKFVEDSLGVKTSTIQSFLSFFYKVFQRGSDPHWLI
jgi:hypothetical protein